MLVSRVLMSVTSGWDPRVHLDSHADTCAFGKNCFVLHTYPQTVNVSGFHSSMNSLNNIKVACVAIAYDCLLTHETFILIFDQVLYIPSLRFRPTQLQLEYPRLRTDVHVDVKKGPCRSIDGNTNVVVYAPPFAWA